MRNIDMIWAEEGGVYVTISEGEMGRRIIEIHDDGKMGHGGPPVAKATIAAFRCNRLAAAFKREEQPNDSRS